MSQTPSVTLMAHYVSYGTPGGEYTSQCRAAVITEVGVYPDGVSEADKSNIAVPIGLCVLNPEGMFFKQGVMQDETGHAGGTWHWPERVGLQIRARRAARLTSNRTAGSYAALNAGTWLPAARWTLPQRQPGQHKFGPASSHGEPRRRAEPQLQDVHLGDHVEFSRPHPSGRSGGRGVYAPASPVWKKHSRTAFPSGSSFTTVGLPHRQSGPSSFSRQGSVT